MPFQPRRVTWLDLNDMSILYEDANLSVADLAKRFSLRKEKVLNLLHRLGVEIRPAHASHRSIEVESDDESPSPLTFRSKSTYGAFLALQSYLREMAIDAEVGSAGVGSGFYIEFPGHRQFHEFLDHVMPYLPADEDVDSLLVGITRRWKLTGRIFATWDEKIESYGYQIVVTINSSDFVKLSNLVTSKSPVTKKAGNIQAR